MPAENAATAARPEGSAPSRAPFWWRGGYMLLFVVALSLAQSLHALLAIVQFLALVIFREPNRHIAEFGGSLAEWMRETSRFLTCAAARKPWPFAGWPSARD